MTVHPKIFIVVLNWNGKDDTLECLDSVYRVDYPNFKVVVVDNGSEDGSAEAIRERFNKVHLIETGSNLGYAGGNNVGIRYALNQGTEFVFILNNDTKLETDTLTYLVEASKNHPNAAVLGPVVYEMDQPKIIWTAGEFFDRKRILFSQYKQGQPHTTLEKKQAYEASGVIGAAFFIKSEALINIGLFDERFFLVREESDWCFRARKAGYICLIVPKARLWHKIASSFGSESSPMRLYYSFRNHLLFAEKNLSMGMWKKLIFRSLRQFFPKMSFSYLGSEQRAKHFYWHLLENLSIWQNPRQKAVRIGIRDYIFRRFGECPPSIWLLQEHWKKNN
ncbi:glycosyltransferase family 2 protein [Methylohalobius crimeensis]|uniref:glycosyltransferase family 2 protein n=1 Tax=Methylohalobius crimeensis TaxID=244365 RepID=UPI0003B633F3|nr:glycosyltransferase family 2 protein [Methylohalobius crimeensis]